MLEVAYALEVVAESEVSILTIFLLHPLVLVNDERIIVPLGFEGGTVALQQDAFTWSIIFELFEQTFHLKIPHRCNQWSLHRIEILS